MAEGIEGIKQTMETKVKEGQIWADNDRRSKGRTLEVISVSSRYAKCKVLTAVGGGPLMPGDRRTTYILLDRMRPTSTGYRLVVDESDTHSKHIKLLETERMKSR